MEQIEYKPLIAEINAMLNHDIAHPEANISSFPDAFERVGQKKVAKGINIPGWDHFNRHIAGLRPHEFTILCGPTGAGKTTLLANLYASLMAVQVPTFAAPVEVGEDSFTRKVISIIAGVHPAAIPGDYQKIKEKHAPLFFSNEMMLISKYQSRVNHKILLADILHSYRTRGTKVCLIDNLNFMLEPSQQENMNVQYDKVIHDWVVFHKHVPVHSIMVMHPKKTDNMRVENEGDIKGSSTAIQEAQNVLLFNRLDDKRTAPEGKEHFWCREIKIAKCRENGRSWGKTIVYSLDAKSEKYNEELTL